MPFRPAVIMTVALGALLACVLMQTRPGLAVCTPFPRFPVLATVFCFKGGPPNGWCFLLVSLETTPKKATIKEETPTWRLLSWEDHSGVCMAFVVRANSSWFAHLIPSQLPRSAQYFRSQLIHFAFLDDGPLVTYQGNGITGMGIKPLPRMGGQAALSGRRCFWALFTL